MKFEIAFCENVYLFMGYVAIKLRIYITMNNDGWWACTNITIRSSFSYATLNFLASILLSKDLSTRRYYVLLIIN